VIRKVLSGGQTGVDRAALDVARSLGIPIGGWCPRGGWSEDGVDVRALYPELRETPSDDPAERTRWNVRDCDAVLVIGSPEASPGTSLALGTAGELARPHLVTDDVAEARAFVDALPDGCVLGIGGPRESEQPGVYASAVSLLRAVLGATP
jgi:hypothetical protein